MKFFGILGLLEKNSDPKKSQKSRDLGSQKNTNQKPPLVYNKSISLWLKMTKKSEMFSYLGGGDDGESVHDAVGVFLTDLGDQESSHSGSGSTSKRVGQLESLRQIFKIFSFRKKVTFL